jgi:hypothetical protein
MRLWATTNHTVGGGARFWTADRDEHRVMRYPAPEYQPGIAAEQLSP